MLKNSECSGSGAFLHSFYVRVICSFFFGTFLWHTEQSFSVVAAVAVKKNYLLA